MTFWPMFFKTAALSLVFASAMLLITGLIVGLWGYGQFNQFLREAGLTKQEFSETINTGLQQEPEATNHYKNILLLGTDSTAERGEAPPLTDTMMLLAINTDHGTINTLPLPRDLWNEDYQTKINALYAYGYERYPDRPEQFAEEVVETMTAVEIHHTVTLSLAQLEDLIDLVDGITVEVEQGFTDPLFPRSGVDISSNNQEELYETVTFEEGEQTMSGETALKYIRSRHSEDEQGHDLARGLRQQQVISALFAKLMDYKFMITHPEVAGELYRFYEDNFAAQLPLTELISTAKTLLPHRRNLAFESHQLTDVDDDPEEGVLDNPPRLATYQYQWVYVIDDEERFQEVVQSKLFDR